MAIQISGNNVVDNSRRGTFQKLNPGVYTTSQANSLSKSEGDVIYNSDEKVLQVWNGSAWVKLAKGTTGHLLEQGSSNAPQWAAPTTNDFNIEAMGRIAYTDGSPDTVAFDGTATNCAGSPSLSGGDVTINFTTTISNSHPKVMLTPVGSAALGLYVTSISTSSLVVHAGTNSAHSFHFAVFA